MPVGRQTCVCQTRRGELISPEWRSKYYTAKLKDKRHINSTGSDLLDLALNNFNVKEPPQTEVHQNKAKRNITPIH